MRGLIQQKRDEDAVSLVGKDGDFPLAERRMVTGFFAEDDELLEDRYYDIFHDNNGRCILIPGGHHVSEDGVKKVLHEMSDEVHLLREAHHHSFENYDEVTQSSMCGCFSCLQTFPAKECTSRAEIDGRKTAWCPHCDVDAVLGDASGYPITKEFLLKMHNYYMAP